MSDYSELKRLASSAKNWGGEIGESRWYEADCFKQPYFGVPDAEFLGACEPGTILVLIAENDALREANDKLTRRNGMLEQNVQAMTETHVLYTWLRKKCDQPSNDFVAVHMNIGHDWTPVHDLDRDLRTMIDREEP
ncbi:hypothetical protein [Pseudomonas mohnii]